MRPQVSLFLVLVVSLVAATQFSAPMARAEGPSMKLSPRSHQPTARVQIKGVGFGTSETIEVSFETTLVATATTDGSGKFSTRFNVPAQATPGAHPVTATGQSSGLQAWARFTVRTDWRGFHFDGKATRYNPYENVLDGTNISGMVERWSFPAAATFSSDPAVANGMVFVGGTENFYAVDALTGAEVWRYPDGVSHPPVVDKGRVYITPFPLTALDASTGRQLWTYVGGGSPPALADGIVYTGDGNWDLHAVDARTGQGLWQAAFGGGIVAGPTVAEGMVYVTQSYGLYAFDASTGTALWEFITS